MYGSGSDKNRTGSATLVYYPYLNVGGGSASAPQVRLAVPVT